MFRSQEKPVPRMFSPQQTPAAGLLRWPLAQPLHRQGVLRPDIHIHVAGPDGIGATSMPSMRVWGVGLDDRPVHEGAGVPFVGVADQVLVLPFRLPGRVPLKPGGEACAALAGQAGDLISSMTASGSIRRALSRAWSPGG